MNGKASPKDAGPADVDIASQYCEERPNESQLHGDTAQQERIDPIGGQSHQEGKDRRKEP